MRLTNICCLFHHDAWWRGSLIKNKEKCHVQVNRQSCIFGDNFFRALSRSEPHHQMAPRHIVFMLACSVRFCSGTHHLPRWWAVCGCSPLASGTNRTPIIGCCVWERGSVLRFRVDNSIIVFRTRKLVPGSSYQLVSRSYRVANNLFRHSANYILHIYIVYSFYLLFWHSA